jgi:hypothetical protein
VTATVFWIAAAVAIAGAAWWGRHALGADIVREELVFVEEDGTVRELTAAERAYVSTRFSGDDSARPYVKDSYGSVAPNGKSSGYLPRERVPGHVRIREAAD